MLGQTVGALLVISRTGRGTGKKARWLCRCTCGEVRTLTGSHLRAARSAGKVLTCCVNGVHRADVVNSLLLAEYKRSAAYKQVPWHLSDADALVLIHGPCFYCGRRNVNRRKYLGSEFRYNGIDRVNSDYGYSPGNVVSCCKPCNYAKNGMSQSEFFDLIGRIAKRHCEDYLRGRRSA